MPRPAQLTAQITPATVKKRRGPVRSIIQPANGITQV